MSLFLWTPSVAAFEVKHPEHTGKWALDADVSWLPKAGENAPPRGLSLPVVVEELPLTMDLHPFGVVRSPKDGPMGHSGIDLRMKKDESLFAVADGIILAIAPVEERAHESEVILLLTAGPEPGTGWGFVYSHVRLAPGITVGRKVRRGMPVAFSLYGDGRGVHFELSYRVREYLHMINQTCWVDQLNQADRRELLDWFGEVSSRPTFIDSWKLPEFGEQYPFRELLDPRKYPNGPQMCYPRGTDVR